MPKFTKKPVQIEAIQYQWDDVNVGGYGIDKALRSIIDFVGNTDIVTASNGQVIIQGIRGEVHVNRGDWIIKQNENDFYPCPDDVFQQNYAPSETLLDCCRIERDEVKGRLDGLTTALNVKEKPEHITEQDWVSMFNQQFHMRMYYQQVRDRIARNEPKPNFVEFNPVEPLEAQEQGSESNLGTLEA